MLATHYCLESELECVLFTSSFIDACIQAAGREAISYIMRPVGGVHT